MFPIFFSVSDKDVQRAQIVWGRFPSNLIYLYSMNGEVGADMWQEISERELPTAKGLVIFWSKNYVSSQGTLREIYQASNLFNEGLLPHVLVVRLDDFPITFNDALEADLKPVFEALSPFLKYRTSGANISDADISYSVEKFIETVVPNSHPLLPRPELVNSFSKRCRRDNFTCYPAMWVSGLNGVGRQTSIREVNRYFAPDGKAFVIDINETSLPKQILLRIEDEALGADLAHLERLQADPSADEPAALAERINRVFLAGHYVVLRQQRVIEERVELPTWLDDVVSSLPAANRPKLFIISQIPLTPEGRQRNQESLNDIRISTIEDDALEEFTWQLIGHFDPHPQRWTSELVGKVSTSAGGTLGLLVAIIRTAASIEDLDQITAFASSEHQRFAESLTAYTRWAFARIQGGEDEPRALLFLNDVSPCDADDLASVLKSDSPISSILGRLLELGLIERDLAGLYRLTPLLSNRLSRDLITPRLNQWRNTVLREFASSPITMSAGDHEYVKIEARLQASFWAESDQVPALIERFQSAAHWFQAGIRLYHAGRHGAAYRILRKAFQQRDAFRDYTKIEVIRYFGLAAIRFSKEADVSACLELLRNDIRSRDIATYLEAFQLETKHRFVEAVRKYEEALDQALGGRHDNRVERIYRPLVSCIIRSSKPDFELAERYAIANVEHRKTLFSLSALAKVYLYWLYRGPASGQSVPTDVESRYAEAADQLKKDPGAATFYLELKAEEFEFRGMYKEAIGQLDQALARPDPRFQLRLDRWKLMVRSGDADLMRTAIGELQDGKRNPDFRYQWEVFQEALAETYATALAKTGQLNAGKVDQFAPELPQQTRGRIVSRVRNDHSPAGR